MKRRLILAGVLVAAIMAAPVIGKGIAPTVRAEEEEISAEDAVPFEEVDVVDFPDGSFRMYIRDHIDLDKNGKLSKEEIDKVTTIDLSHSAISDLAGIEYFTNLTTLYCNTTHLLRMDLSKNTKLKKLNCSCTSLKELDLRNNIALEELYCDADDKTSKLESIDLHCNLNLKQLSLDKQNLTSLDLNNNLYLERLFCSFNKLKELDLGNNQNLKWVHCNGNDIKSLNIRQCSQLDTLDCSGNELTNLDLSTNTSLEYLDCRGNKLTSLDVSTCDSLLALFCGPNQLTSLDVSKNEKLRTLYCHENKLTSLDVSQCPLLITLYCHHNQLSGLDVSQNADLEELYCHDNPLKTLDLSNNTKMYKVACYNNKLTSLDVSGCSKLAYLYCEGNALKNLDLSQNAQLIHLHCYSNKLTSLDLSNNSHITKLYCSKNPLESLDVSNLTSLYDFECYNCKLTSLDVSNNKSLYSLYCYNNQITSLDLLRNLKLYYLYCYDNKIEKLDISNCAYGLRDFSEGSISDDGKYYDGWHQISGVEWNHVLSIDSCVVLTPKRFDPITTPTPTSTPTPTPVPTYTMPDVIGKNYEEAKTFLEEDLKNAGFKEVTVQVGWAHVDTAEPLTVVYQDPKAGEVLEVKEDSITVTIMVAEPTTPPTVTPTNTPTPVPGEPTPTTKPGDPTPTTKPGDPTPTTKPGDPTPIPDKDPSIADFVERLYTIALNRESDPEGKAFWVKEIEDGNRTGGDCAYFFLIESPEFKNRGLSDEDFVETLYKTFFDRASEAEGKAFWVDQLKKGTMTRDQVIMGFIDSKEWCNVCADYGVKSGAPTAKAERASKNAINFATRLYTCCLGREPEEAGLKYWSLALTNLEQTGCSAAKEFFTCQEFVNFKLKDDEYVKRLYRTFMDREPKVEEVTYWTGEIAKGTQTRASVLAFFGQSEEFTNICKKYGIDRGTI